VAPNPFSDEMVVACETALEGPIVLEVVDPTGRLRRRIETADRRLLVWDGRDASGAPVPAGNYYLRVRAGDEEAHARVTVVR
jgi:flagellar hook assembly protein FlgD